jgi:transcription factor C subunit 7
MNYTSALTPPVGGETIPALYERAVTVVQRVLDDCESSDGPKAILICTHAALMIVLGRVLTGRIPEDPSVDDFQCFTASMSVYRRRRGPGRAIKEAREPESWKTTGVRGGWECEKNSDCSYLSGGPERGW